MKCVFHRTHAYEYLQNCSLYGYLEFQIRKRQSTQQEPHFLVPRFTTFVKYLQYKRFLWPSFMHNAPLLRSEVFSGLQNCSRLQNDDSDPEFNIETCKQPVYNKKIETTPHA